MKQSNIVQTEAVSLLTSDSAAVDAFSRVRTSDPETLFEVQSQYGVNPLRMEGNATGTGVAPAWSANTRLVTLQVNAGGGGGTSYLQSYEYVPYQPGKSHLILLTGVMGLAAPGAVKRFGYGDGRNGIFYEQNGTNGLQFNRRTYTSGGAVDNPVTQSNWNLDKFDGTGPSGILLDATKAFILVIDLQFLGMGRVRIGFDINGIIYYAHQFLCANVLTVPYIQSATLPVMCEIVAAAALAAPATSSFKCAAVVSEGGFDLDLGRNFATEGTVTAASGARTHILSLQPMTTFNGVPNRVTFALAAVELLAGSNPVLWELCIGVNFGVTPPTYAAVNTYSGFNAGTAGTFVDLNAGIVIASGYIASGTGTVREAGSRDLVIAYPITLDRAGAVRALGTMSLLVTGVGGTSACRASMEWREIR